MASKRKRNDTTSAAGAKEPSVVVSYGLLLYKIVNRKVYFLLGLVPQRNWWTIFKGLSNEGESSVETAIREFEEETGSLRLLTPREFSPKATLYGQVGKKKRLEIFLHEGSFFEVPESFCLEKVVAIDKGYMKGQPEIVDVQWCTLKEALSGMGEKNAKIYKSQKDILKEAYDILSKELQREQPEQDSIQL